jgi:hypothetical protein
MISKQKLGFNSSENEGKAKRKREVAMVYFLSRFTTI